MEADALRWLQPDSKDQRRGLGRTESTGRSSPASPQYKLMTFGRSGEVLADALNESLGHPRHGEMARSDDHDLLRRNRLRDLQANEWTPIVTDLRRGLGDQNRDAMPIGDHSPHHLQGLRFHRDVRRYAGRPEQAEEVVPAVGQAYQDQWVLGDLLQRDGSARGQGMVGPDKDMGPQVSNDLHVPASPEAEVVSESDLDGAVVDQMMQLLDIRLPEPHLNARIVLAEAPDDGRQVAWPQCYEAADVNPGIAAVHARRRGNPSLRLREQASRLGQLGSTGRR